MTVFHVKNTGTDLKRMMISCSVPFFLPEYKFKIQVPIIPNCVCR